MKRRESLSGQVVAANLLLVVAALFAASVASSLDLHIDDQRLQFALLAMTGILALLLNILMLQRRFSPLEELIRQIEEIDPADPAAFQAPDQPVEEVERLAHAFGKLLERIEAERRRAGRLQIRAQEEERKRVARDLHDEVNQALTAILLRLEALTQIAPPRLRDELAETKRLAHAFGKLLERIEAERRRAGRLQIRAQEEERKRVARDLHDEVNQALTAILLRLEALTQIAPPRLRDELAETKGLANQAMEELLQLARQLRPTALDDHGFLPAIEEQLRRFKAQHGVEIRLTTTGSLDDLGSEQQLVLYRVTQEALNNIARHARASHVDVAIRRSNGSVALAVTDDGEGFDYANERRGLGLDGMAERARLVDGDFEVSTRPGKGTKLQLTVPA